MTSATLPTTRPAPNAAPAARPGFLGRLLGVLGFSLLASIAVEWVGTGGGPRKARCTAPAWWRPSSGI